MILALLSVSLLLVGFFTPWLQPVRAKLDTLALPFYWVVDLPNHVVGWFDDATVSRSDLIEENNRLTTQITIQEARLQQMASIRAENIRLRQLMESAEILQDRILSAELIGVSPDPSQHKVIINKGSEDGVYLGQPLLDAFGLMGQVVSLTDSTAQVLLITDNAHAIPVQVIRNNVRTIAEGVGDLYRLRLRYVSAVTDIREGDVLVSSGLGGRFPVGYPVAVVQSISIDPSEPFAEVIVKPAAQLDRSRHVLLVFSNLQP